MTMTQQELQTSIDALATLLDGVRWFSYEQAQAVLLIMGQTTHADVDGTVPAFDIPSTFSDWAYRIRIQDIERLIASALEVVEVLPLSGEGWAFEESIEFVLRGIDLVYQDRGLTTRPQELFDRLDELDERFARHVHERWLHENAEADRQGREWSGSFHCGHRAWWDAARRG